MTLSLKGNLLGTPGSFFNFVRAWGLCLACLRFALAICFSTFALCLADDLEELRSKAQVRAEAAEGFTVHPHVEGLVVGHWWWCGA